MSFIAKFYIVNDDPRKIIKNLGDYNEVNFSITDSTDLFTPRLILKGYTPAPYINYCYIPQFNRYYFITKIEMVNPTIIHIYLECDVLMTYADNILNANVVVVRNESIGVNYVEDSALTLAPYKDVKIIEFSDNEFNLSTATANSFNFLLNVAGGGGNNNAS